ncbi:MAG: sodium:calcium antiporter [Halanaerobiales bacterium]
MMAILIVISGTYLSRYGEIIADITGLGQILIGGILIALATSLPELVTSITSSLVGAPNIAIGNSFGSNTFNLMILAVIDLFHGPGPLMLRVHYSHLLSGLMGILLSGIVVFSIIVSHFTSIRLGILGVGFDSIVLIFAYLVGLRLIYRYERKNPLDEDREEKKEKKNRVSLRKAVIIFFLSGAVIVFAGSRLSILGDQLASATGINQTFIGTILVAAATSLPELVASLSAMRIHAYNMAIGNVLGSNIFNMIIVFFADVFYRPGYILATVDTVHVITATIGLMMSAIALIGLFYRSRRTIFSIGWDSLFISIIYFIGVYLLFRLGIQF